MAMYNLYYVFTARNRPGKSGAAARWWQEKGQAFYESFPGVKSVRAYAGQFGLSGTYSYEIWTEIENYAVMDRWDEVIAADPEKYGPTLREYGEIFESGPARLVGDWPESLLTEPD